MYIEDVLRENERINLNGHKFCFQRALFISFYLN